MNKINSETDFLRLIDQHFPAKNGHVTLGRGDDCSIINTNGRLCLSKDLFIENIHFRRSYFSPKDIGYKSLAVNISDIAAMGADPCGFELGLMIPEDLDYNFLNDFLMGMSELAADHNVILAGGDLTKSPIFGISITIWGEAVEGSNFLTRGNAKPDDILFTHGLVGLANCGLMILEEQEHLSKIFPICVEAHLRPKMRVKPAIQMALTGLVKGMMDISDGLARDLPRFLAASGPYGADIELDSNLIHPEIQVFAKGKQLDPAKLAFMGGEDYALLGAATEEDFIKLSQRVKGLNKIGRISEASNIKMNGKEFSESGFDHFSR